MPVRVANRMVDVKVDAKMKREESDDTIVVARLPNRLQIEIGRASCRERV